MASKKSIVDLLPKVGTDNESSDFPFRFNRHVTGDFLGTEEQGNFKDQKQEDLCQKIEKVEKPRQLIPPAGVLPPTAEELMKLKKSQPESVVDCCKPVEYQFLPLIEQEQDIFESVLIMPHLEGMHAPGYECSHMLRPAGFNLPYPPDVYRFNRVLPYYPPDLCIRPNEGDLVCPPENPPCARNHPCMPASGTDSRMLSDVFRFHKVYKSTSCNPCKKPNPCSCATKRGMSPYLCCNKPHYPPSKPTRHFDYRYPAGATGCNLPTHRHGHVPKECKTSFPGADEIICFDTPNPTDCDVCQQDRCVCGNQSTHARNAHNNIVRTQVQHGYNNSAPSYNIPLGNGSDCTNASMYNNISVASSQSMHGNLRGKCYHSPYALTGTQFCDNSGFVRDRNAAIRPVQNIPCPTCAHSYFQTDYVCRPVYDRTYLLDCPEQDGPPADTYTFL